MPAPTYLSQIIAAHRAAATTDGRKVEELRSAAVSAPPTRPFRAALAGNDGGLKVVAEIKRRSPSKGELDPGLEPGSVAVEFEAGGASCLSVLTDRDYFGGSPDDLRAARLACTLPVLRKDFTVSRADVYDARTMGADALLLIVAALSDAELGELHECAVDVGLDVVVEVHDEAEIDRALAAGADIVGVNQRDLSTFEVDHDQALQLAGHIPDSVTALAESGVRHEEDARRLADAGFDAVLVGETLMRSADRAAGVRALAGAPVGPRLHGAPVAGHGSHGTQLASEG